MSGEHSRLRLGVVAIVVVSLFAALFARLWYLQVMNAPAYSKVAESNSTVTLPIPAPRGRILDRNGNVLVDNKPSVVVAVDRQALEKVKASDAVLGRLAGLLNRFQHPEEPFTLQSIHKKLASNRVGPYDPVPLATGVSDDLHVYLVEHAADFPAVVVEDRLLRQYHYGPRAAQLLGYVGPISDETWQAHRKDEAPYEKDAQVGRAGVEQSFEKYLRGRDGQRIVEVDRAGRAVRTVRTTDAVPGDDVYLSIDIDAQAVAEDALAQQLDVMRKTLDRVRGYPPAPAGAAVLLDPTNGQVLALASNPSYDPSLFVPYISTQDWAALNDPAGHHPFTDRAVAGLYSPGSTFKLVTSLAGLKAGLVDPTSTINDGAYNIIGCKGSACVKHNDNFARNGLVALPKALTVSSDVYYYRIGDLFWQAPNRKQFGDTPMQDMAKALGLGEKTGIELPDQQAGRMPDPKWKAEFAKQIKGGEPNWYSGDNLNVSIGQGDVLVTPLQLAGAYGQFAVGGTRYRPTLLSKVTKAFSDEVVVTAKPEVVGQVQIQPDWHAAMTAGFEGVVDDPKGTAYEVFQGFPLDVFPVAGKTGTAETATADGSGSVSFSNALFAGYGPVTDPRYVGVSVLEKSGYGATAAAPVVRQMLEGPATGGWPKVEPTIPVGPPPATPPTTVAPPPTAGPPSTEPGQPTGTTAVPGTGETPPATDRQPADSGPTTTGPVATGGVG